MKYLMRILLSGLISLSLVVSTAFAGDGKVGMKAVSSSPIVSSNKSHCEELLMNALLQIAWQHTARSKLGDLAREISSEIGVDKVSNVDLPFDVEIESSIRDTRLNIVYRF